MTTLPIQFSELLQLQKLGIQPQSITFASLTMESDKFVCVREPNNVVMIPTANPTQMVRRPIQADHAIMNPTRNVLALAAGTSLSVFDMDGRAKLGEHTMTEPLVFWHWVSDDTIGMVTGTAVYHWKMGSAPVKMFDRLAELSDAQIISYKTDAAGKWLALCGIAQRNGQIAGSIQLYSVDRKMSQHIEGHACAFANYYVETESGARATRPTTLFVFAQRNAAGSKMLFLPVTPGDEDKPYARVAVDIPYPADAAGDFPVAIQVSEKYEMAFLLTKAGFMHMLYLGNGKTVYRNRISADPIFIASHQISTDGLVCINRKGQVLALSVDTRNIVNFLLTTLNDYSLALSVAGKNNLPGAENIFLEQFRSLMSQGKLKEAAAVAFRSPGDLIRNAKTIAALQQMQPIPGDPRPPLLLYFGTLLDMGKLNKLESVELARVVLQQNRVVLLEKWLQDGKFECSEEMGDLVRPANPTLALQIYVLAGASAKVVQMLAETGQQDKIAAYCQKTGYSADFKSVLATMLPGNPAGARAYAAEYFKANPNADVMPVIDAFQQYNLIQDLTSLMLDVLKDDKPEQGAAQTRLLEISLLQAPPVADAILGNNMFHHYNRQRIGQLCEQAGLYQRALEHYTEMKDIKRVMMHAQQIKPEFLVEYFATRSVDESLELLQDLLRSPAGPRANLQVIVQIAVKYQAQLTPAAVVALFDKFKCYEGTYYFLNQIVATSEDPEVHYKYIEACVRTGQYAEVERMCRESNNFDPAKVRDLLKESKMPDQLPFIIVCDRFGFIEEMTRHLYQGNHSRFIQAYVQKINPANTPAVVGALLDAGCNEDYIKALIMSVSGGCPIDKLVEAVSSRNRLKIILPWLEQRNAEGNTDVALHNALAMCYVDMNNDPEEFLNTDDFYDAKVVGAYCESRDPYLAFVAYRHGKCDDELLKVTNEHSLFKYQAQYLVKRMDAALWARVLSDEENAKYKKSVVDQVVQSALPECENPEEVKETVKAFMAADMPSELIDLLEKIVLEGHKPEFSDNKDLQNLLILTAVKANPERVMEFVTRLNNYDAPDVANICISSGLHEEAFTIFSKFKHNVAAIQVLIEHIKDLKRARDFADKINEPEVYSRLAKAQLDEGLVPDAIASFIKADDHEYYVDVIAAAESAEAYEDLVKFLLMCRKKVKEAAVESELLFAYAKTGRIADIEEFIAQPNCAQIQAVGDRCFGEALYEAAKILYTSINNFVRLASTLLRLKDFAAAVDAARKANSTTTWREVTIACLDAKETRLAQTCALNIIVHSDEICEVISQYERRGFFDEAITLLETGITMERTHPGMFTELALLYSKYREEKLMEYLRANYSKMQPAKVIRCTRDNQQWKALTFLYMSGQDYDHAAEVMMEHSADAWDHVELREALSKVLKTELLYRAVDFYLLEHPKLVNEFLQSLIARFDHAVVVDHARRRFLLPLIKPYLVLVQTDADVREVNEALNELLVEELDYQELRRSIELRQTFDQAALAQKLERHECLEFRRIAATVYAQNKRFAEAVELSKKDELWADAMTHAAHSGDRDIAEDLLRFFIEKDLKPCFVACLYTCYDLLRPDVVMELGWRHGLTELMMPFMIQTVRETTARIETLEKKEAERTKREEDASKKDNGPSAFDPASATNAMLAPSGFGMLALPPPPGMDAGMGYPAQQMPMGAGAPMMPDQMGMNPMGAPGMVPGMAPVPSSMMALPKDNLPPMM